MKNEEKRPLNMEEKRKLEKIIFADIDTASDRLRVSTEEKVKEVQEQALKKAPSVAGGHFETYKRAKSELEKAEKAIEAMGYRIERDGNTLKLSLSWSNNIPETQKVYAEGRKKQEALQSLKREYTIRLFAGAVEAKEIFAGLEKELAKITG